MVFSHESNVKLFFWSQLQLDSNSGPLYYKAPTVTTLPSRFGTQLHFEINQFKMLLLRSERNDLNGGCIMSSYVLWLFKYNKTDWEWPKVYTQDRTLCINWLANWTFWWDCSFCLMCNLVNFLRTKLSEFQKFKLKLDNSAVKCVIENFST